MVRGVAPLVQQNRMGAMGLDGEVVLLYKTTSPNKEVRMACLRSKGQLVGRLLVATLIVLATTLPLKAEDTEVPNSANNQSASSEEAPTSGAAGIATYYAKRYNGRRTTSGVRYDPQKFTAAHQSLPFGTQVKVVNLANDREIIVTVNDRCRKRRGPFIDLSRAAAKELGFLGKGVAKVTITPIEKDPA
jgi:rare lipoprotein A